jgi:hypothetical protein
VTAVSFTVRGTPAPQGSKRALVHRSTGRAVVMESAGQGLKDWRSDVKAAALNAMLPCQACIGRECHCDRPARIDPLSGPLAVSVAFTLPKPKSAPKTRRTYPCKRPDLDKLVRAVLDAMTGIVFADDAQVVRLSARKCYPCEDPVAALAHPGARIMVRTLVEGE